jgi:hypothetical protein
MWFRLGRLRTRNLLLASSFSGYVSAVRSPFVATDHAVTDKHIDLINTRVYARARVCVYIYIDMMFRENIFQTANMFSVPNAGYFIRKSEFHVLLLERGLSRGNWVRLFLKIRIFQSCSCFSA